VRYSPIAVAGATITILFSEHAAAAPVTVSFSETAPAAPNATVFLPSSRPAFAEKLSQGLIGFSIEMDRWTSWAGEAVGKPNPYVNQVLSVMASFTGVQPPFRVGGMWLIRVAVAHVAKLETDGAAKQPTARTGLTPSQAWL
jgi:hypothetical protein